MVFKNLSFIQSLELFFIISISLLFYTCKKNTEEICIYPNVDEPLHKYFKKFEEEGKKRGVKVDLIKSKVYGSLTKIHANSIVGICDNNKTRVFIDKDFWDRSSDLSKELIIFHELGHCYLKLPHKTNTSNDGVCQSIMRPGNGNCLDFYTSKTREKMIDELFTN